VKLNMTNVYDYTDYRRFLREAIQSRKQVTPSLTFSRISDEISVQRSYMSQVLGGKGNLNSDQIYLIGKKLNLGANEIDYLMLLAEIDKCQVKERRVDLESQRNKIRNKNLKSEKYMSRTSVKIDSDSFSQYYNDPYCSLVHMYLLIENYHKDLPSISKKLNISDDKLSNVLSTLEKCGIINVKKKSITVQKETLHLSDKSFLSRTNATMFRLKAIEHHQKSSEQEDYFFTASIAADEVTRAEIKKCFLEFLKKTAGLVEKSPSKRVYHLNFDLFGL